jgi:hypothetical protein
MTLEDIKRIEAELEVRLPGDYRALMLAYPFPPDSFTAEFVMPNDAPRLIEINRERSTHELPPYNKDGKMPSSSYFEIGGDGGEESYLIDLAEQRSPVYVYDLETAQLREAASDLQSFVKQCAASDEMIRRDEEFTARKAWWQFWR